MKAKIVVLEERQHQGAPVMPNCTANDTSESSPIESYAWTRNRDNIAAHPPDGWMDSVLRVFKKV